MSLRKGKGFDPKPIELSNWIDLQHSGALKALFDILKKHQDHCKKEALSLIKQKQFEEAMCEEAKASDQDRIITQILNRINYLKKGGE